jgi:hypothetical protein
MIQIRISDERFLQCHNFAEKCADSCLSNYKKRGQGNREKIINDILSGKLLEIGAYRLLKKIGLPAIFPDFQIYDAKGKSWDADIVAGKENFHIKSQTKESADCYGESWVLSYGVHGTDRLFKDCTKNDYLIPGFVDQRYVIIVGIYSVWDILENGLIGMPRLEYLKKSKRCIYKQDLDAHYGENYWGKFDRLIKENYAN